MGSGDWFKNIITLKKVKDGRSKQIKVSSAPEKSNGFKSNSHSQKQSIDFSNGASNGSHSVPNVPVEDVAAARIQTAFRAYKARKAFRRLKGTVRLQNLTQGNSVKRQASTTLSYLHSWTRIQAEIRARRLYMVTEGRNRQKKLENQLKLEAKLHDLEVEWSGGSETMEETLARIHQREEAAFKRERAMAYAFSHQWRANSNPNLGPNAPELGKANWGWSWMERWIAARPWESRVPVRSSPKRVPRQQANKASKKTNIPTMKATVSVKSISPNGKGTIKARKLSYGADEANTKKEQVMS